MEAFYYLENSPEEELKRQKEKRAKGQLNRFSIWNKIYSTYISSVFKSGVTQISVVHFLYT